MGLLDKRRERKAEAETERQRAQAAELANHREQALELLEGFVEEARTFTGVDAPGFEEKKGERTFAILEGVALTNRDASREKLRAAAPASRFASRRA